VKREDFLYAIFLNGVAQGQSGWPLAGARTASPFTSTSPWLKKCVRHHFGSDNGDDDLVTADDSPAGGFGKGQAVGLLAIDGGIVHGKQQPGFAFAVAVVRVVMARRGGEEQAFADGKILVVEGQGEVAAFASGGLCASSNTARSKASPGRSAAPTSDADW